MKNNEILKAYGKDYKGMTIRLLEAADIASEISAGAGVGIKPNLVSPVPAKFGATTHPEIVAGIIEYLQAHGIENIGIYEGSWVGDSTADSFEYCGFKALSESYGVPLFDTQKLPSKDIDAAGMPLRICSCIDDIDYLINVPVIKGHCQLKVTCALKNLKGLLPNSEKRRFHKEGLHRPIAHLNAAVRPALIVVDHICGDPEFEDGGNPLERNCVMLAKDPVLTDSYAAQLLGYKPDAIEYISLSEKLGIGSMDLSSAEIRTLEGTEFEELPLEHCMLDISYFTEEIESCSACYSVLVEALRRLKAEGLLEKLPCRVSIGQANKGRGGRLGIGACCSGFDFSIKGCPPTAEDIYKGLREYIEKNG